MIEKMKALVRAKDTCVLATAQDDRPHCSLMSYVPDGDCKTIFMVTHRETKKFKNLAGNPNVSLLIDTREGAEGTDRSAIQALTVTGTFVPIANTSEREEARVRLLAAHPHLRAFLDDPGAEIFAVRVRAFQLLEGITDSSFVSVE